MEGRNVTSDFISFKKSGKCNPGALCFQAAGSFFSSEKTVDWEEGVHRGKQTLLGVDITHDELGINQRTI